MERLDAIDCIMLVVGRDEAVRPFELPADRIGDIVIISEERMTIGTSEDQHDLAALKEPLRSHGGLTEQEVPFIVNRRIGLPDAPDFATLTRSFMPRWRPLNSRARNIIR